MTLPLPLFAFRMLPALAFALMLLGGRTASEAANIPALEEPMNITFGQLLETDGPPLVGTAGVLFRFTPPEKLDVKQVHLAGSFNNWASNDDGVIRGSRFAMRRADSGVWYKLIDLPESQFEYQYVVETADGAMIWIADPKVDERDGSNSVGHLGRMATLPGDTAAALPEESPLLQLSAGKVWVAPGQPNLISARVQAPEPGMTLHLRVTTPWGRELYAAAEPVRGAENVLPVSGFPAIGGYVAQVALTSPGGETLAIERVILSVTDEPEDDLRYGFFASYPDEPADYTAKADMLADLYVNAVEFYDYFPAHGNYAPQHEAYKFEPFGIAINGLDVKAKIEACQRKGILALAYIAAYAASESVYREIPDPMTDAEGTPKIFNGEIMTERRADAEGKQKWFWLMNISEGSRWRSYIMPELERALRPGDGDIAAFDGFEIDTYGDNADARFYADGSRYDGEPLAEVLQGFVADVTEMTRQTKAHGLVSFNSVNEFGVENMYGVTDFLFLEIWRWHAPMLSDLVDICFHHRAAGNQRVILKLYPADMDPPRSTWPPLALARLLGAAMTGGGSLMVVGEPDETTGRMHALNSLYYPDHQPLSAAGEALLKAYYAHDAMLYGYTHGREVDNRDAYVPVEGCVTRSFISPVRRALCLQMLNLNNQSKWSEVPGSVSVKKDFPVSMVLPEGVRPTAVFYASPDSPQYQLPVKLAFELQNGQVLFSVPELAVYGTVIVQY
jgi:hypothetical protein